MPRRMTPARWMRVRAVILFAAALFICPAYSVHAKPAPTATPTPFQGTVAVLPGTIDAARFDDGGSGVAYWDRSAGNAGGLFRETDVDVTSSSEGGYLVGWTEAGEWLLYTVSIQSAGRYQLQLRVASAGQGGTLHVELDGANVSGSLAVPDTGGWQSWRTIATVVSLPAGFHRVRLVFDTNGPTRSVGNVAWIAVTGRSPYGGVPTSLPGPLDPERFDEGGEGLAYHDATAGNAGGQFRASGVDIEASAQGGYDIGWTADGEWLAYTVDVASAATYTVSIALASPGTSSRLRIESGGTTTPVTVPATGGWQQWTTVTAAVPLAAGRQSIVLIAEVGGFNLGRLSWAAPASTPEAPTSSPSQPASRLVAPTDNLQAAIDTARPGDTLLLTPGGTYVGNFVLPVKDGTAYVTLRSSTPDAQLPPDGVRLSPSAAPLLPVLKSPNTMPALATAPGAHHYRLSYLEFQANVGGYSEILRFGDGSAAQNTLASVPHDLLIDHCYVHGDPVYGQKRGLALNSASTTVRDSHFADFKAIGADSQAIGGWNGPGPFTILNNRLEAAGEVILFGGADPAIPSLVPSDILVRGNHLSRPLAWMRENWQVKNLFELKNAQRVVVEGNIMENHWVQAQPGYAVLFTPRNQDGTAPWTIVQHVRFANNVVRHASAGINILGNDDVYPSQLTNDIVVENNLFEDISGATFGGPGRVLLMNGGANITFSHNTVLQDGWTAIYAADHPVTGLTLTNNIVPDYSWAIMGVNASPGNNTIGTYFPGGLILGNIIAGASPSRYPAGNFYPASLAAVGFENLPVGNYRLAFDSPYRNSATDGSDVGCLIDRLNAAAGTTY